MSNPLSPSTGAGYFFATYMVNAVSKVLQYNFKGDLLREVTLPGVGSVSGFVGKTAAKELYFSFTNYNTPNSSYKFNPKDGIGNLQLPLILMSTKVNKFFICQKMVQKSR